MFVGVLGPLIVEHDGRSVEITGARMRVLVIHLALVADRVVAADVLAGALWPDDAGGQRVNALQTLVSRLRRRLPAEAMISSVPGGYRLHLPADSVDALRFERLVATGRQALRDGDPATAIGHFRQGLRLWRGRTVADAAGSPYAEAVAARLEELRLSATEDCLRAELDRGDDPKPLVADLEELTTGYPMRERMRALLITALTAAGRRAEALTAYDAYRTTLADKLGADPGAEVREAHLAALRGNAVVPHRTRPRGNLRPSRTSLVGRADMVATLRDRLTAARLVTLVGPGGVGKTRVAGMLARTVADDFPGGIWLVDLAAVTDPGDTVPAMLAALRVRDAETRDAAPEDAAFGRLVEALSSADTLVLLDNCEHLIGTVARLADELLGHCAGLRLLATSREPLGVPGEMLAPVPPLPVPPSATVAEDLAANPAIQLFADRASAVRPDFRLTDENVAVVADICRRLDGLPLAIELAAARLSSLPVAEVAARLGDRFNLLTGGNRIALPRHQTLRAVVTWSWALLDERERQVVQRLAIFAGTISVGGAEAVATGGTVSRESVLEVLGALVDKSLMQLLDGAEPRYRMLETIREYALERLVESEDVATLRAAYARHFLGLAQQAAPHLAGAGQLPWLHRLRQESVNLIAALRFAEDAGDHATTVGLMSALGYFWTMEGSHAEAAGRLRAAVDQEGRPGDADRLAALGAHLFNVVLSGGQARPAVDPAGIRAWADDVDWQSQRRLAALIPATVALLIDDIAWGVDQIDLIAAVADPWTQSMLELLRAFLQGNDGHLAATRHTLSTAVDGFRISGDRWGLAMAYTALAEAQAILSDHAGAAESLTVAIGLLRQLDPEDDAVLQRTSLAAARIALGDIERARGELVELVSPDIGAASSRFRVFARIQLGNLARYEGDRVEAARQYGAARADLHTAAAWAPLAEAMLNTAAAQLALDKGDAATARRLLAEAFVIAAGVPDMPITAAVAVGVAHWVTAVATTGAAEVLGAAHALRGAADAGNPDVARTAAMICDRIGKQIYAAEYERGARLARPAALALVASRLRGD